MKWTEETTVKFVKEYLGHECLYNSKSYDYRNKFTRDAALRKICEVMNIPDFGTKEAVAKIKSIRSTYSQERKKIGESTKSNMAADELYVPCLKWYKMYHDCIKEKGLTQIITQDCLDSTETDKTAEGSLDSSLLQETEKNNLTKPNYSRKRNLAHFDNLEPQSMKENEFEIFGKGVAAQLNAMPLIEALQAQSYIQNYLTSIRIQTIRQVSESFNYSASPLCSTTYKSIHSPSGERIIPDNVMTPHDKYMIHETNQYHDPMNQNGIICKCEENNSDIQNSDLLHALK